MGISIMHLRSEGGAPNMRGRAGAAHLQLLFPFAAGTEVTRGESLKRMAAFSTSE